MKMNNPVGFKDLKKKENVVTLLFFIGMIIFLILIMITNIFHYFYKINADIAAETVLCKLIWDSKELIPDSWYIGNEARIVSTPNVAALFYGLTENMALSVGITCCIMTILIVISAFYAGKRLGFTRKENVLFVFLGLAVPMVFDVLEVLYLFACYYSVHVIAFFFTLGVYGDVLKGKKIKKGSMAAGILFALVLGIQGVRGILVLYAPLFGIEIIRNGYRFYCKRKAERADYDISLWVIALLLVSFLGTTFPVSAGQSVSRNIRNGFSKLFTEVIPNMGKALGFDDANVIGKICLAVLLLVTLYLLIDILFRMFRKKEMEPVDWSFLVVCSSPAVTALMLAFTTTDTTERYHFMLGYTMAFAAILAFRKIHFSRFLEDAGCLLVVLLAVSTISTVYVPVLQAGETEDRDEYEVVRFLEENGFSISYSTFFNANIMTTMANGRIRIAPVASLDKMSVCRSLSSSDWYVPNMPFHERTAYIIPEGELENFEVFMASHAEELQFETQIGRFMIYSSDDNLSNLGY